MSRRSPENWFFRAFYCGHIKGDSGCAKTVTVAPNASLSLSLSVSIYTNQTLYLPSITAIRTQLRDPTFHQVLMFTIEISVYDGTHYAAHSCHAEAALLLSA